MKCGSLKVRAFIVTVAFLVLPAGVTLAMCGVLDQRDFEMYLALHVTASCLGLLVFPRWIAGFLVECDLRKLNNFCVKLKNGHFRERIAVTEGTGDHAEDQLSLLKQNLNWLAHSISTRDERLLNSLINSKEDNLRLNELSFTDHLSGVFNKRFFDSKLAEICARSLAREEILHLLLLDCDHFKAINDKLGHLTGDMVLVSLGNILSTSVRSGEDYPFRFGGDEFGCLFCGASLDRCLSVAENIRREFSALDIEHTSLTLSIGIAALCQKERDPASAAKRLVAETDKALYLAKQNGRDRIVVFQKENRNDFL